MKTFKKIFAIAGMVLFSQNLTAQSYDDLLNLLISRQVISQEEADSIRAESAIKAWDQKEKQKNFIVNARRVIQIGGYTQLRFQSFQESGKADGMDVRRARLDIRGNVTPVWEYRLQTDFATSPKLLDATIAWKPNDYFRLQAGQSKLPFSMENLTASNNMDVIERSQPVEALVARARDIIGNHNGRDIGVQASGNILKINDRYIIDYFAGVFNGAGINTVETNEAKDFVGRLILHPLKGLDAGISYYNGYSRIGAANSHIRNRIGAEIKYTYKIVTLKGEYIDGEDGAIRRMGYYGQASVFIWAQKLQLVTRYDTYDTDTNINDNITTNVLGGVNYYFNDWAKIQVNYTSRNEEGNNINNDIIGIQLQIGF